MCNAWNHNSFCTCGWGGDGHLGRSSGGNWASIEKLRVRQYALRYYSYERKPFAGNSYINPNARCPECGETVFFYQSPYGGKVFFDNLGPPWPKHPCTDNSSLVKQWKSLDSILLLTTENNIDVSSTQKNIEVREDFVWAIDKWYPLYCYTIKETRNYYARIVGSVLFVEGSQVHKSRPMVIYAGCSPSGIEEHPLFIRKPSDGLNNYEIASIEVNSELVIQPFSVNANIIHVTSGKSLAKKARSKARLIKKKDIPISSRQKYFKRSLGLSQKKNNETKNRVGAKLVSENMAIDDFAKILSKKWKG